MIRANVPTSDANTDRMTDREIVNPTIYEKGFLHIYEKLLIRFQSMSQK